MVADGAGAAAAAAAQSGPAVEDVVPASAASRTAAELQERTPLVLLSCLLDFCFDPFVLQHSDYMHGLIKTQLGPPNSCPAGPWTREELLAISLGPNELLGADSRVEGLLAQLPEGSAQRLGELVRPTRLRWLEGGRWGLRAPPEVRYPLVLQQTPPEGARRVIQVLSHAVDGPLMDTSAHGHQRRLRLGMELGAHPCDVACLQGLDPEGLGGDIAATFSGWGYSCFATSARHTGGDADSREHVEEVDREMAVAVFWNQGRWRAVATHRFESGVSVDLQPRRDGTAGQIVRIACIMPQLTDGCFTGLEAALRKPSPGCVGAPPIVVCADLAELGGADAAAILPGLASMRSAMVEAVGAELSAPCAGGARPRQLWRPGSILVDGVQASSVLAGHTDDYLAWLPDDLVRKQFPAGRPLLWAELCWDGRAAFAGGDRVQ